MTVTLTRSVLVVDDDTDIRQTMRFVLEDAGYTVYEAPDGKPAMECLRTSRERMVVLLDYQMPGMDGRQVMEAVVGHDILAARHAYILVTANATTLPLDVATLLANLQAVTLAKPFDIDNLLALVDRAFRRLSAQ